MKLMLVSIIMPSYNAEHYIGASIESIIAQSYTDWELLITDDCSTDNSCEIIENYSKKDSRVKLFKLTENQGAAVARNNSIEKAQGRYIAFCDSDDRWIPKKLETQLKFMSDKKIDVCFSSYQEYSEDGKLLGSVKAMDKVTFKDIKTNNYIGCLTCIYDTINIGKVFQPLMRKRQDWAMNIKLIEKAKVAYAVNEELAYYTVRTGSISRNKFDLVKYNIQIYRQVLNYGSIRSWLMFIFVFLPNYFIKKL